VSGAQQNVACNTFAIAALQEKGRCKKLKFHLKGRILEFSFAFHRSWRTLTVAVDSSERGTRWLCVSLQLFNVTLKERPSPRHLSSFDLGICSLIFLLFNRLKPSELRKSHFQQVNMASYLSLSSLNRHREISSRRNAADAQPGHDHLPEPPSDLQACGAMFVKWLRDSGSQTEFSRMMSAKSRHDDPARKLGDIRKICPDLRIHISDEDDYEVMFSQDAIALLLPFGGRYQGYTPHSKVRC
jgi:hypothetical protein